MYDKTDDFNFAITNFPHRDSNILTAFAYGLYFLFISQLVRNLYSDLFWGGHRILSATYYKFKVDFF